MTLRVAAMTQSFVVPGNRARWERLAELHPDADVTLITPSLFVERRYGVEEVFEVAPEQRGNYRVVPLDVSTRFGWYHGLGRTFRAHRPDVLHVFDEPTEWMLLQAFVQAGLAIPRARRLFYYYTNILSRPTNVTGTLKNAAIFALAHGADVGSADAESAVRGLGYRGPLVHETALGADERVWTPAGPPRSGPVTVGFLGGLMPEKGVADLVRAFAKAASAYDARLLIGGDGSERDGLQALASRLGISDRTSFAGAIERSEAPAFIREMDALVLPSRTVPTWKEQFGLVLVEAMLSRVAVVGSDCGAIPEVIGDAGKVYPEGDVAALARALDGLLSDAAERRSLAERGRHRALEHYSCTALAERTYRRFRPLVGGAD